MSVKEKIVKFFNWFEDLFMTNHSCIGCGMEIADGTKFQLCDFCKIKVHKISGDVCKKCGDEVLSGNNFCDYCKNVEYKFDENCSYCYYDEVSAKIVKRFKYNGRKYYAKHIAEMMTENREIFDDVDVITFVPSNTKTLKERRYNQAEELAKEISRITGIKACGLLKKSDDRKHQAGLTKAERLENLKGSFSIVVENKNDIKGNTVLIVDDVFTTGATLNECSKVILKHKPKKIKTITFAKTKLGSKN